MEIQEAQLTSDKYLENDETSRELSLSKKAKKQEGTGWDKTQQPVSKPPKHNSLDLKKVEPKTENQAKVFEAFNNGKNLLLHGLAGTGKTFLSLYLALTEAKAKRTNKVKIFRSIVPTRDSGFLPGTAEQKNEPYEETYYEVCFELYGGRPDAYNILVDRDILEFKSTSFLRGITIRNSIILIEECQNYTFHELDSLITRVGEGSRVIITGDYRQTDFVYDRDKQGLGVFLKILDHMDSFERIEFDVQDIVRSGLVREYILAKDRWQSDKTESTIGN